MVVRLKREMAVNLRQQIAEIGTFLEDIDQQLCDLELRIRKLPRGEYKLGCQRQLALLQTSFAKDVPAKTPRRKTWSSTKWLAEAEALKIEARNWEKAGRDDKARACLADADKAKKRDWPCA